MLISIKYGNFEFASQSGYPVPKVTIDRSNIRTSSQQYLGSKQIISLDGIIYTHKMAPQYSSSTAGNSSSSGLLDKAIALKERLLLGSEPKLFLMLAGSQPVISGSGYIQSINFDTTDNRAVDKINYSISIELYDNQTGVITANKNKIYNVSYVQDSIEIESNLDQTYLLDSISAPDKAIYYPTYTISRTISANGNRDTSGSIIEAVKWINDRRIEFPLTGIIDTGRFPLYNYSRSLDIDEQNGSINIRDTFLSKLGHPWIDSYDVSTSVSEDFVREIKINGKIEGLHKLNKADLDHIDQSFPLSYASGQKLLFPLLSGSIGVNNMKYTNALSGYENITGIMYDRALLFDGQCKNLIPNTTQFSNNFPAYRSASLHPLPFSITEGLNPNNGTIDYSYSFNSRPLAIITGALSETFSITDNGPIPRIANIPVIGRRLGPVVYFYTASSGAGERTVSYEGVFTSATELKKFKIDNTILNSIENYLLQFKPQSPFTGLITANNNTINLNENRIRKSITWQYTKCSN